MEGVVTSSSARQEGAKTNSPGARVALWDNARFVVIVFVVQAHVLSTIRTDNELAFGLYAYGYLFHMPVIFLIAGMFTRTEVNRKSVTSTIQLLTTWVIWEGLWALIRYLVNGDELKSTFVVAPAWTLWFLVSLATMRILLPYVVKLRFPLLFSIAAALVAGLSPSIGTEFSASRTFVLFPFFVLGWYARKHEWFSHPRLARPSPGLRVLAWSMFGAVALVVVVLLDLRDLWRIDTWLTWREDYEYQFSNAPVGDFAPEATWAVGLGGVGVRALLLVVSAAMTFALITITSRRRSVISAWGTRTIYVYLLHGPVVWTMREAGLIEWLEGFGTPGVLVIIAAGVLIAVLLSMRWVEKVFRPIIEPPVERLLQRRTKPEPHSYP